MDMEGEVVLKVLDIPVAFLAAGDFLIGSRRWVVFACPTLGHSSGKQRAVIVRTLEGKEKAYSWLRKTHIQVERHVEEGTR